MNETESTATIEGRCIMRNALDISTLNAAEGIIQQALGGLLALSSISHPVARRWSPQDSIGVLTCELGDIADARAAILAAPFLTEIPHDL